MLSIYGGLYDYLATTSWCLSQSYIDISILEILLKATMPSKCSYAKLSNYDDSWPEERVFTGSQGTCQRSVVILRRTPNATDKLFRLEFSCIRTGKNLTSTGAIHAEERVM